MSNIFFTHKAVAVLNISFAAAAGFFAHGFIGLGAVYPAMACAALVVLLAWSIVTYIGLALDAETAEKDSY